VGFETRQIHAGTSADTATGARAVPIYQTTSFVFVIPGTRRGALWPLGVGQYLYAHHEPNPERFEERIASLEGVSPLWRSSGSSAETIAILNLAENGGHVVSSASLYGGTYNLFHYTLPKLGIETTFVDNPDDLNEWQAAIRPNTRPLW